MDSSYMIALGGQVVEPYVQAPRESSLVQTGVQHQSGLMAQFPFTKDGKQEFVTPQQAPSEVRQQTRSLAVDPASAASLQVVLARGSPAQGNGLLRETFQSEPLARVQNEYEPYQAYIDGPNVSPQHRVWAGTQPSLLTTYSPQPAATVLATQYRPAVATSHAGNEFDGAHPPGEVEPADAGCQDDPNASLPGQRLKRKSSRSLETQPSCSPESQAEDREPGHKQNQVNAQAMEMQLEARRALAFAGFPQQAALLHPSPAPAPAPAAHNPHPAKAPINPPSAAPVPNPARNTLPPGPVAYPKSMVLLDPNGMPVKRGRGRPRKDYPAGYRLVPADSVAPEVLAAVQGGEEVDDGGDGGDTAATAGLSEAGQPGKGAAAGGAGGRAASDQSGGRRLPQLPSRLVTASQPSRQDAPGGASHSPSLAHQDAAANNNANNKTQVNVAGWTAAAGHPQEQRGAGGEPELYYMPPTMPVSMDGLVSAVTAAVAGNTAMCMSLSDMMAAAVVSVGLQPASETMLRHTSLAAAGPAAAAAKATAFMGAGGRTAGRPLGNAGTTRTAGGAHWTSHGVSTAAGDVAVARGTEQREQAPHGLGHDAGLSGAQGGAPNRGSGGGAAGVWAGAGVSPRHGDTAGAATLVPDAPGPWPRAGAQDLVRCPTALPPACDGSTRRDGDGGVASGGAGAGGAQAEHAVGGGGMR